MKLRYLLAFPGILALSLSAGNLINQPLLAAPAIEIAEATTAEDFFSEGNQFYEQGHYEKAIESYDKAIEIKPDYFQAWGNRGIALGKLEKYEEAILSFDKVTEIKPDNSYAWYNRGIALGKLEKYEEAILSYDKAVEINPDDSYAWHNRGNCSRKVRKVRRSNAYPTIRLWRLNLKTSTAWY